MLTGLALAASGPDVSRYIVLLVIGVVVTVAGHLSRLKPLIALGLMLIVAGTLLFQLDVRGQ